ncbi:hypothetical protein [Ramlibacter humi]|uniref:Toxin CptA n=1 Tax=Ramlibacter humi TaxID=2530451 RepID=A0A4Z0C0J8_9BURK|nr:hypothetical protein [Ramlibacter humi]TFZ04050.1 hypothetical protein EZ216_10470 [Ramlibacter humi]
MSYPVGRSPFLGRLLAGLVAAGAAACAAWALLGAGPGARWLGAAACAVSAALALGWWWRAPAGLLDWDGNAWRWSPQSGIQADGGTVDVTLDCQRALLLRWRGEGRAHWFWLDRSRAPARWDALRRAVYSPAPPGEHPRAGTPPARP